MYNDYKNTYTSSAPHFMPLLYRTKLKIWCDWCEKCGNGRKQEIRRFTQAGTPAQLRIDCPLCKNHCICKRNTCANQTSVRIAQKGLALFAQSAIITASQNTNGTKGSRTCKSTAAPFRYAQRRAALYIGAARLLFWMVGEFPVEQEKNRKRGSHNEKA